MPRNSRWQTDHPQCAAATREAVDAVAVKLKEAQRYLEDLTPGGSEYHDNPKRCFEWASERMENAQRLTAEACARRNRLLTTIREALYDYDHGDELSAIDRLRAAIAE